MPRQASFPLTQRVMEVFPKPDGFEDLDMTFALVRMDWEGTRAEGMEKEMNMLNCLYYFVPSECTISKFP
jgi:hypothetical protein